MLNLFSTLYRRKSSANVAGRYHFCDVGFHGDLYLIQLVHSILEQCDYFVETGTNVGSTLAFVAKAHPHIQCFSCEPDEDAYRHASNNVAAYSNVQLWNETSQDFMGRIVDNPQLRSGNALFWLDAHGYGFEWPLQLEVNTITTHWDKAFVLIDDFLVPGKPCFGYDEYLGQVCSFDYIRSDLSDDRKYRLYYPRYQDKTSKHHPLRGWGLMEYGHEKSSEMPHAVEARITANSADSVFASPALSQS